MPLAAAEAGPKTTAARPGAALRVVRLGDTRPQPLDPRTGGVPHPSRPGLYHDLGLPRYVQGTLTLALDHREREPATTSLLHLLPDPGSWGPRIVLHIMETTAGYRRVGNLARHVTPDVLERVARRHALAARRQAPAGPVRLRLVRTQQPTDGVCELAAVVEQQQRRRAVAARLVGVRGRWVVSVLELG